MTATGHILVSRFPGTITPGALPMLPSVVTVHRSRLGGFFVFRWFDDGGPAPEQAAPDFRDELADALALVPAGYELVPCPDDFAVAAYRLITGGSR